MIGEVAYVMLPEISRVEVIDDEGRAYVGMNLKNMQVVMQDGDRTLKIFVEKS